MISLPARRSPLPALLFLLPLLLAPPAPADDLHWSLSPSPAPGFVPDPLVPGLFIGRSPSPPPPDALPPFYPPLPSAAHPLPACVPVSHSIRFDSSIAARNWTLFSPSAKETADFPLLRDADNRPLQIALFLESIPPRTPDSPDSPPPSTLLPLHPERYAREGGHFSLRRGTARAFTGTADSGAVEWLLALEKVGTDRWLIQGRLRLVDPALAPRFYRLRLAILSVPAALPLPSPSAPAAVFAPPSPRTAAATALYADLSEPRRLRALPDFLPSPSAEPAMALEFDLALTPLTRNFPSRASFSAILSTWLPAAAPLPEALARLPRPPSPDSPEFRTALDAYSHSPALTNLLPIASLGLRSPLPFLSPADALAYLRFRSSSSRFPDAPSLAPALPSLAASPLLSPSDPARATFPLNPDPDIETPLLLGSNWGKHLLPRLLALARKQGGLSVSIEFPDVLDPSPNALAMADFPAVWDPSSPSAPLVLLAHPQCEFLAALACALHEENLPLAVCDPSPNAPFTTYHADMALPPASP